MYPNGRLQRPVTSFESPPGKAGFRVSGSLLLGDFPPLFDQLHQHLAAIAQALAFLELVNKGDRLARQPEQDLLLAGGRKAAPVSADVLGYGRLLICLHDHNPAPIYL